MRHYTVFDQICGRIDNTLRLLHNVGVTASRPTPAAGIPEADMSMEERQHAAGLMRVNHVGEVCAQALYEGQALTGRSSIVVDALHHAAIQETDHLVWCSERLKELNSRPSYLNIFWYVSSFTLGVIAGLAGDAFSLGFVVETEKQVEEHLAGHMKTLPALDAKSRAIVEQMKQDEMEHADTAASLGSEALPHWVKTLMRCKAKWMTTTAYWI